ncbi:acetyl-CoA carboxylase biotin carboxyl carrier protein [Paramaledivibacter caminithermalis]|jgi:acetyl-CoA carboxylase biotin carboxyl carrier protein|uniref:Biotin carboxyl carrier protein of acetyl-CoA carboxylase n=1 Tax=Paramaledivibacter caminithermalis (strain DSM 15212 / CIP 107654 / DViRD3) TaxID=1121301 RepID=A0A1M6QQ56_PARC5|nr:acetyl-CoA carboxylase biotin carboxyl carrier protein [Paramaledivibacter caminithermalis]SHK22230.1 acetyl-CoA carboxylase biotin carboxyl carrier protein [Paramaledivibacter caminithermalis DSM 15212]
MNLKDIKELILTIDKTSIQNVEIEENDFKIKISKSIIKNDSVQELEDKREIIEKTGKEVEENKELDSEDIYIVKSPIVGVFYDSPSPDSVPFVKVGDRVKKDQSLCIIEAMKIMNEIQSEESGEVIEILVENEDIVEYGQPLMKIRR